MKAEDLRSYAGIRQFITTRNPNFISVRDGVSNSQIKRERQTERDTDRQTDRQTDKQTDTERDRVEFSIEYKRHLVTVWCSLDRLPPRFFHLYHSNR